MKYLKKTILFSLTISILFITFFSVYVPVCASDHGGSGGTDHGQLTEEEKRVKKLEIVDNIEKYLLFLCSEIGVYFSGSGYSDFYKNYVDYVKSTNDKWFEDNVSVSDDGNAVFSETLMSSLKAYIDQYAKENEPYYMVNTLTLDDLLGNPYSGNGLMYNTAKNLIEDSPSGVVAFGAYYSRPTQMFFADIGHDFTNVSAVMYNGNNLFAQFYNNETWNVVAYSGYEINLGTDAEAIKTAEEFKEKSVSTYNNQPIGKRFRVYPAGDVPGTYPYDCRNYNGWLNLITKERRRIRVFNTYGDFQNYTLGKRNVYYTSEYYNYVPEDLTTSIDDLQKTVDDLSGVIDQLLDQITKDTDESEIEELLKQILDELKNQQGTGGGGGTGGGDVNVDIDLSTTNGLLSKILAKVTQIFDKISETAGSAADTAGAKIQETLDEILVQIKKIKHWTIADTAVGAADAVADWLDFLKDLFSGADDAAEGVVGAISSTMDDAANLMKTKFPFCIPWDVYLIVSFLAEEPQTPVFRLPIKLDRLGIEEYIEVNLEDFEVVSSISRTLLTLLYCYFLLNLTTKIFPIMKEGGD